MTNNERRDEIRRLTLEVITDGKATVACMIESEVQKIGGFDPKVHFREIDRSLQSLRKKGLIAHHGRRWGATEKR